jgi:acylphosphatase
MNKRNVKDMTYGEMPSVEMNESSKTNETAQEFQTSQIGHGFISGNTFDWKPVVYSIVNGTAIFEGDIVLGTIEEMQRINITPHAILISGYRYKWRNGIVPFEEDPGLTQNQQILIANAITLFQNNTTITFINRTTEPDFVFFQSGVDVCQSPVGRRGGRQNITLSPGCDLHSTIHEIGHAVGLFHEQSREDRDQYVKILWENIKDGILPDGSYDPNEDKRHNFNQHITDGDDVGDYDYCSVMHYQLDEFTKNGQPTIQLLGSANCGYVVGQGNQLSAGDIAALRQLYPFPGWISLGGVITSSVAVGNNRDGRLEVFVRGTDGAVYHKWQTTPNGGWIQHWYQLGGFIIGDPVVGQNEDGRLEVFVRGPDNALWKKWQTTPNGGWIEDWYSLNSPLGGGITNDIIGVGNNRDGRLEVFVKGGDNALYKKWQTTPNGGWIEDWYSLGGVITSNVVGVGNNRDGRLEVFVRGPDNALWKKWQTTPNGGWIEDWYSLGGVIANDVVGVGNNRDGRLEVFVKGADNVLYHKWQTEPNGGWYGYWDSWDGFGGVITSNVAVANNQDGRLEVFVRGEPRFFAVWHKFQTAPNNGWSA